MDKRTQLEQIRADIIQNNVCPDLAKTATNLVMGDGSLDADVILIGEAPGKNEDIQGLPFVGAAGKFLDQMLASAEMSRQDVYITNIVKYRPPNNRDPRPDEKRDFWPYLVRQIEVIRPKILATLGRHSMEYFLPGSRISEVHGKMQSVQLGEISMIIIPLYHPAAALYNGGLRTQLIEDFMKLPKIIEKLYEKEKEK